MKIEYRVLSEDYSVKLPEIIGNNELLKVFSPYDIPEVLIMPGDDAIIPTGLVFPDYGKDYIINLVHSIFINKESDILGRYKGTIKEGTSLLHMSPVLDSTGHLFISIINLGKTEMVIKSGVAIGYLGFSRIEKIECAEKT